jgi:hypothetical protein
MTHSIIEIKKIVNAQLQNLCQHETDIKVNGTSTIARIHLENTWSTTPNLLGMFSKL